MASSMAVEAGVGRPAGGARAWWNRLRVAERVLPTSPHMSVVVGVGGRGEETMPAAMFAFAEVGSILVHLEISFCFG